MSDPRAPLAAGNPRLKHLRRLLGRRSARREAGQCVVEGPTLVAEALASGAEVVEVYVDAAWAAEHPGELAAAGDRLWEVREGVLARVLDTVTPQPVAALVQRPEAALDAVLAPAPSLVVALDAVADPGNVGTLVRSAAGAGATGVVLGAGCADPFGPKALRASAGAVLRLPVLEADLATLLPELRAGGRRVLVASAGAGPSPEGVDLTGPVVVVLGNEAHGVRPEVAALADGTVAIPLAAGTESLNVAMAGTVLLFEAARQRRSTSAAPSVEAPVSDGRPPAPTA